MNRTDESMVAAVRRQCGETVVDLLVSHFGGERISIPLRTRRSSRLAEVLSVDQFEALISAIGGESFDVPLGDRPSSVRNRVRALLSEGASVNQIVRRVRTSRRTVFNIKAQMRAELRSPRAGERA